MNHITLNHITLYDIVSYDNVLHICNCIICDVSSDIASLVNVGPVITLKQDLNQKL